MLNENDRETLLAIEGRLRNEDPRWAARFGAGLQRLPRGRRRCPDAHELIGAALAVLLSIFLLWVGVIGGGLLFAALTGCWIWWVLRPSGGHGP